MAQQYDTHPNLAHHRLLNWLIEILGTVLNCSTTDLEFLKMLQLILGKRLFRFGKIIYEKENAKNR